MNRLAYLLAGMVVGAAGMAIAKKVKDGDAECSLQAVVQGGHNVVEKVLGAAETLKEDVEDFLAESKYRHEEKVKAESAQEASEAASTEADKEDAVEEEVQVVTPAKKAAPRKRATPKKAVAKATPKPRARAKAAAKPKPAVEPAEDAKAENK